MSLFYGSFWTNASDTLLLLLAFSAYLLKKTAYYSAVVLAYLSTKLIHLLYILVGLLQRAKASLGDDHAGNSATTFDSTEEG